VLIVNPATAAMNDVHYHKLLS